MIMDHRQPEPQLSVSPPQPFNVLILDMDPDTRQQWRHMLQTDHGVHIVGETHLVGEAIQLARSAHPHLIILDPKIPDWNQHTILQALRQWSPASLLFVATTVQSTDETALILASGARFCFDKFRDLDSAIHALAQLLHDRPTR